MTNLNRNSCENINIFTKGINAILVVFCIFFNLLGLNKCCLVPKDDSLRINLNYSGTKHVVQTNAAYSNHCRFIATFRT